MIDDLWYKNAIIYCLSVGTYMDANGDGIGDFKGLLRRLDYLHGLGITTIWLMPFQTSPGRDDGYDVADYYSVDARYGTLGDFVEFTHGCKQRGIRVIIDLVVNHTSDQHPWFKAARSDRNSPYRDWYVWSDKKPANANQGMALSRRSEIDMDARQGSRRLVLPPLLRFPARPQHLEPARAGRDFEDHGLLDPTRRLGLSDGCRAFRHRDQRRQSEKAGRTIRHAADVP
ncbi:hypothetical protein ACVWXL_007738 [Bradyrhizobium sp. GM22.5]